jgi:hypothetical protein
LKLWNEAAMPQSFLAEKIWLTSLVVGTLILQKKHEAAVDALPELERDVVRELLRP